MAQRRSMTRDLIGQIEEVRNCNGDWGWLLEELVGPEQLWLRACRQAVAQGRGDWLARFLPGHADPHWFLDLLACCGTESQEEANAICERFIGSLKRECLDHMLILHAYQLHHIVRAYVEYYNHSRPHQGIGQRVPAHLPRSHCLSSGPIIARPVLGGLHHAYSHAAYLH